jgi:hypothetical protein
MTGNYSDQSFCTFVCPLGRYLKTGSQSVCSPLTPTAQRCTAQHNATDDLMSSIFFYWSYFQLLTSWRQFFCRQSCTICIVLHCNFVSTNPPITVYSSTLHLGTASSIDPVLFLLLTINYEQGNLGIHN